jgi:hypothetical protein
MLVCNWLISKKVTLLVKDYYSLDKEITTDHSIRFNINEHLMKLIVLVVVRNYQIRWFRLEFFLALIISRHKDMNGK